MGAKERRERIKQATRQGILDGARQIAQQEGWTALTIRKVADFIEYSPSIVYEYFDSKDAILHTLLQDGFDTLAAAMEHGQQATDDPQQQVVGVIDAYWQFARDNPDLYQVMHGLGGVTTDAALRAEAVQAVCTIAADTLTTWAHAKDVQLDDPVECAEIVWSLLHGWVSLTLIDQVYTDEAYARQRLHRTVQALLRGWETISAST
ncbi:MAG: TetR/AcrR family transcriptional regulator [Chloroflexota bacterium]